MNIFILDKSPSISAHYLCDKHVPKMTLESAQLLACALLENNCPIHEMPVTKNGTRYKGGYKHHPCAIWTGQTLGNYLWLCNHALELTREFYKRYEKVHACTEPILVMCELSEYLPKGELTDFVQAMPEQYKNKNAIKAYREYYNKEKNQFAQWKLGRAQPKWYNGNNR